MKAAQLVLDLPLAETWEESDFFVTARNGRALSLIKAWPAWEAPAAIVFGPPQSGKTYLAKLWQKRSQAAFLPPSELAAHRWTPPYKPLIFEDLDRTRFCETALFHHLNLAREHSSFILLTAAAPPGQWPIELPDLRSRIRSYPAVGIEPPDDEHLAALLLKHFADRQIEVGPDVIAFLMARMERTMAAAQRVAAFIDKLALAEHRRITKAFVVKALNELDAADSRDDVDGEG
ncbi:MAG TPA: DnaA/Hda family protein [Hyphomicrobiales bacterium]|nr:DnaA/Hda family protein [Hyphomicrobiales bacterium]